MPNFVSYELDHKGDLYLKYFLADASVTEKPTANGHFSLDGASLAAKDKEVVGLPFTVLPNRELSVFGDFHPWHPDLGSVSWQQHVDFAKQFSPGEIVAVTPHSQFEGAAQDVVNNNGRFAIVKITDQRARDAYLKNPEIIPRAVSPGFLNHESPNRDAIKNFQWTHLAAVPQGAYGDKATLYASCVGGGDCVNKLFGASVLEKAKEISYCPVGASESLASTSLTNGIVTNWDNHGFLSSLDTSKTNQTQMSDTANAVVTPVAPATAPTSAPAAATQTGAPIASPSPAPILRLKGAVTPQQNAQQTQGPSIDNKEFEKVQAQLQELQAARQQAEMRTKLTKMIPIELFRVNGKIDEKAYNGEIEKRVREGWTEEYFPTLEELYNNKMQIVQLATPGQPFGGSSSNKQEYQTPSYVPEPTGGGVDIVAEKTKGLFSMFHLEERL